MWKAPHWFLSCLTNSPLMRKLGQASIRVARCFYAWSVSPHGRAPNWLMEDLLESSCPRPLETTLDGFDRAPKLEGSRTVLRFWRNAQTVELSPIFKSRLGAWHEAINLCLSPANQTHSYTPSDLFQQRRGTRTPLFSRSPPAQVDNCWTERREIIYAIRISLLERRLGTRPTPASA